MIVVLAMGDCGGWIMRRSASPAWRMPPNTIKVDRSTPWGNPFVVGRAGGRAECVARFARLLAGKCASEAEQAWLARALAHRGELKGKNLACWCAPSAACHADAAALCGLGLAGLRSEPYWRSAGTSGKAFAHADN
jgi:Domain of unknown function (DUF4326)